MRRRNERIWPPCRVTRRQSAGAGPVVRCHVFVDIRFTYGAAIRSKVDDYLDPVDFFGPTRYAPQCRRGGEPLSTSLPNIKFLHLAVPNLSTTDIFQYLSVRPGAYYKAPRPTLTEYEPGMRIRSKVLNQADSLTLYHYSSLICMSMHSCIPIIR